MLDFVKFGGNFEMRYLKWVVMTFQPMSTCEQKLFREMIYEANPKIKPIDRHTITYRMNEHAARTKVVLCKELNGQKVALTCDHWTSLAKTSYLACTVHYIDSSWRLISFTLSCAEHRGGSSADDCLDDLKSAWLAFGLNEDDIVGVVTDTAPVMGAFGRLLPKSVPHIYCVDHVVELTTVSLVFFHFTFSTLNE